MKIYKILFVASLVLQSACATTQLSSGFVLNGVASSLPEGVPKKVGVLLFDGNSPINMQATEQFAAGLTPLGFEVIERNNLDKILQEYRIQYSGVTSEEARLKFGELLGLEGLFMGAVTGESSATWIDSHVNVRFVDIRTGKSIWSVTAKDPRLFTLSTDVRTSIVHSTKKALSLLKSDLIKISKQ